MLRQLSAPARLAHIRLAHAHAHAYVHARHKTTVASNSPLRVPEPLFDNTAIKRRSFKGKTLHLVPLDAAHAPDLWVASGKGDAEMGKYLPGNFPSTPLQFNYYIRDLANVSNDPFSRGVSFCIQNMLEKDLPIGITTLRNVSALNKTMEIGFTWIDKDFWGTHVNLEAKYILMEEAFEFLKFNRVAFVVDSLDTRSQRVMEGMGATREGLLRSALAGQDKTAHDAVVYSVIESEWSRVKATLRNKIIQRLRKQTEVAKAKLEAEGLLEGYEKAQRAKAGGKGDKVVRVPRDKEPEEDVEDERDESKFFHKEDEEVVEAGMKGGQKKRPKVLKKTKLKKK